MILTLGIIGYDVYEFLNMQDLANEYNTKQNEYHEVLNIENENNKTINELENELADIKASNEDNNKEYRIWLNLNKTIQDLLK